LVYHHQNQSKVQGLITIIEFIFHRLNYFRSYFGEINITGNTHDQSAKTKIRLKEIEQKSDDAFVFLSDVWLDDKKVDERQSHAIQLVSICFR
jgi:hypothetical protein